jgi:hypothetical protein
VRLLDVVPAGREDVEDEPPVGEEELASRLERGQPSRRSSSSATPASSAACRQISSIPAEESTPMTETPAAAVGIAIRPVPTPSSTTGPPDFRASAT